MASKQQMKDIYFFDENHLKEEPKEIDEDFLYEYWKEK